jgi:hypothetical protein
MRLREMSILFLTLHNHDSCEKSVQGFWWESLKERDHSEDQSIDGRIGSEWILERLAGGVWIGFDWLRIGTDGGLL